MDLIIERRIKNCIFIFFAAFAVEIFRALTVNPYSPDGCLYIDIARNFAKGAGFYTSYNLYQYWGGHTVYYPAMVFTHPLYPLLAGIVWYFFHSLAAVNAANVFLSGINCLILYLIVERIYNARVAFYSAFLVLVSWPMYMSSTMPWSEQLHLFFVLAAVWCMTQRSGGPEGLDLFFAGLMLGLSYLVRVSGIYNLIIFSGVFIALFGLSKKTAQALFLFLSGFLLVLVPYEAFCYIQYHIFYPEYPHCARVLIASREAGGSYFSVKPVLRLPEGIRFDALSLFLNNFPRHLASFAVTAYECMSFLFVVVVVRSFYILKGRKFGENLFLGIGAGHILLFSAAFYWMPTRQLEGVRYFLIPSVFWIPLGVAALYDVNLVLFEDIRKRYLGFYFLILMAFLIGFMGHKAIASNQWSFINLRGQHNNKITNQAMYQWIMERTAPDEIVATSEYYGSFGLDRPVVSLPEGKMINETNMKAFLKIYHPKCILLSWRTLSTYKALLDKFYRQEPVPLWLSHYFIVYTPESR